MNSNLLLSTFHLQGNLGARESKTLLPGTPGRSKVKVTVKAPGSSKMLAADRALCWGWFRDGMR